MVAIIARNLYALVARRVGRRPSAVVPLNMAISALLAILFLRKMNGPNLLGMDETVGRLRTGMARYWHVRLAPQREGVRRVATVRWRWTRDEVGQGLW